MTDVEQAEQLLRDEIESLWTMGGQLIELEWNPRISQVKIDGKWYDQEIKSENLPSLEYRVVGEIKELQVKVQYLLDMNGKVLAKEV